MTIDADNVFYCLLCCGISGQQFCANWIICNGTKYRPRQTLLLGIDDDVPVFVDLHSIFVDNLRKTYFVNCELETTCFDGNYHSYEVITKLSRYRCVQSEKLLDHHPLYCRKSSSVSHNGLFITLQNGILKCVYCKLPYLDVVLQN